MDNQEIWDDEPDLERLNRAYRALDADRNRALAELRELAEKGSVMSMVYIGWTYNKGFGGPIDLSKAEEWYRRASDKGSPLATCLLALVYLDMKKFSAAEDFLKASASKNFLPAIYRLGVFYLDGAGVEKKPDKARELLERAALLGHVVAKRRLAGLLIRGHFGFLQALRGCWLLFASLKDYIAVSATDPISERLQA